MMQSSEAVIPVAGYSERMGRFKPEIEWRGMPIVRHVAELALRHARRVFVVTGYRPGRVRELLPDDQRVVSMHNAGFEDGMFSSIQTALERVTAETFFVFLADMPAVPDQIVSALARRTIGTWARPSFHGTPGHPVRIHADLIPELRALDRRDGEMRQVLHRYRGELLPSDHPGVYLDLDTPEDLRRLEAL